MVQSILVRLIIWMSLCLIHSPQPQICYPCVLIRLRQFSKCNDAVVDFLNISLITKGVILMGAFLSIIYFFFFTIKSKYHFENHRMKPLIRSLT